MSLTEYNRWRQKNLEDPDLVEELEKMAGNAEAIEDAFYRNLAFGTGGLRGVIGAGSNRMNIYTVAKASQGIANDILKNCGEKARKVAVSYDSRNKSKEFAQIASEVFAANGITVYLYPQLMPTPCLSYAVRELDCAAGVMITASHNPAKYNGYKVYGSDGCQITTEAAKRILAEIEKVDIFGDVKRIPFDTGMKKGAIASIPDSVYTGFVEEVKKLSLAKEEELDKHVKIVYSPLNGTGLKPVIRTLSELGYTDVTVVKEQEKPDGDFPTCPYPNPEIREAMQLSIEYAKRENAELVFATDPDCDRVGIAVRKGDDFVLLSGNETGCLLLDYICKMRIANNTMPKHPVMVKTIVTTDMGEKIASHYGVETINVLTGFKFIGEQIALLEEKGRKDDYIFGFEESYGYLSGTHVRDKDAVNGATLICEMFAYYKAKGIGLLEQLQNLYEQFGYVKNSLYSFEFEGAKGAEKMKHVMQQFRGCSEKICGYSIHHLYDYSDGIGDLPKSDVLKYVLENDCSIVVRPSGTEPKLKLHLSICASDMEAAENKEKELMKELKNFLEDDLGAGTGYQW